MGMTGKDRVLLVVRACGTQSPVSLQQAPEQRRQDSQALSLGKIRFVLGLSTDHLTPLVVFR